MPFGSVLVQHHDGQLALELSLVVTSIQGVC